MSWGYKILIVYLVFVSGIVYLVIRSSGENQDLVTTDYYEQELKYQEKIDETKRANLLSSDVQYNISNQELVIRFPEEMKNKKMNAHVLLYCIADKNKDVVKDFNTTDGMVTLKLPAANKGLHDVKVSWEAEKVTYYNEHKLMIQ